MSVARRIATAAGETHRAQRTTAKPRSRATQPTALVEHTENSPLKPQTLDNRFPIMVLPATQAIQNAISASSSSLSQSPMNSQNGASHHPQSLSVPTHSLNPPLAPAQVASQATRDEPSTKDPPPLTEFEAETALKMMSRNRGGIRCWGCREDGHDFYNCPYVPWPVRMLFAKANYAY